jgi:hypothetical protein
VKVLFVLKKKESSGYGDSYGDDKFSGSMETGLLNSAKFVNDMLVSHSIDSTIVVVHDNNDIDREVTKFKPDVVIIEALWVVPEKFDVLHRLHPNVQWVVRLHSALSFIANEGSASNWILEYLKYENVHVSCNDYRILNSIKDLARIKFHWPDETINYKVLYQPNYYPLHFRTKEFDREKSWIDVACFGAIRPLKNQLVQAVAAVKFAHIIGKRLNFHINGTRIEMKGAPILHNLVGLFEHLDHKLVMHEWRRHEEFKQLTGEMDIGLQVSYTETFNIVTADLISEGVPVVTSSEVLWVADKYQADPNDVNSIVDKLKMTYEHAEENVLRNQNNLRDYDIESVKAWFRSFKILGERV